MFMPPKTYDCNIIARKLSKSLLVMHFIVYGKENKKKYIKTFQNFLSSCMQNHLSER